MAKKYETPLTKIQRKIDRCNKQSGCDSKCSPQKQAECQLLKDHMARRDHCREQGYPIHMW